MNEKSKRDSMTSDDHAADNDGHPIVQFTLTIVERAFRNFSSNFKWTKPLFMGLYTLMLLWGVESVVTLGQ